MIPSTLTRVAGVAGTFPVTFSSVPTAAPTMTIYSDAARTVVAVATATLVATANPAVYTASYPATLAAGTYYLSFSAVYTVGQPAIIDQDDSLILTSPSVVVDEDILNLITLDEAKHAINMDLAETKYDDELVQVVAAASQAVDDLCGAVVLRQVTEVHDGGTDRVFLRKAPVSATSRTTIVSVAEYSGGIATVLAAETLTVSTANDYLFDLEHGWIDRRASWRSARFVLGGRVQVVYNAGRYDSTATVAKKFKEAAKIVLAQLWRGHGANGGAPVLTEQNAFGIPSMSKEEWFRLLRVIGKEFLPPVVG